MKNRLKLLVACATVLFSTLDLPLACADCGKMVIHVHVWQRPPRRQPRPFYSPLTLQVGPVIQQSSSSSWQVPDYGQGTQMQQQQQNAINQAGRDQYNFNLNSSNSKDSGSGMVAPPPPAAGGAFAYGDDTFIEGNQQAVIAWNGKTDGNGVETLILTTNEKSATGQPMAMLSVLPLPGEPLKIERANAKVFIQSKILLDKKLKEQGNRTNFITFSLR